MVFFYLSTSLPSFHPCFSESEWVGTLCANVWRLQRSPSPCFAMCWLSLILSPVFCGWGGWVGIYSCFRNNWGLWPGRLSKENSQVSAHILLAASLTELILYCVCTLVLSCKTLAFPVTQHCWPCKRSYRFFFFSKESHINRQTPHLWKDNLQEPESLILFFLFLLPYSAETGTSIQSCLSIFFIWWHYSCCPNEEQAHPFSDY